MAGPSEIVLLDDVSEVAPEHPAGRPLDGAVDGGIVTVEGASVSYLERGRLVVQTVLRDITERVRVREELAEREQRFHGGRGGDRI